MQYQNIFDTHSHYDDDKFDSDRFQLLKSLPSKGIAYAVSCGCDIPTSQFNKILSEKFDFLYFSAGLHPENLEGVRESDTDKVKELAQHEKCVAIGEIGLDYHWMSSTKEKQRRFFELQIHLAKELDMPIIVHDREAHGDTMDILRRNKPKGVFHCFGGSKEMAKEVVKLGMYIGIGGIITFKNARKSLEVVKEIPLDRLVFETDSPYLAPEPCRGKRNDSSLIAFIAQKTADALCMDTQKLLDITYENAKRLYNIK